MKKNLRALISCMSLGLLATSLQTKAQSVIYDWNFNNADSSIHTPSYTATGAGSAHFNYYSAYIDFVTPGSSLNMKSGDTSGYSLRVRNPTDSLVFWMPTTGFKNVKFSYAEQRTNNGPTQNTIRYTTDGTTFVSTTHADAVDSSVYTIDSVNTVSDSVIGWAVYSFNFGGDTMTNNNAHFAVDIVFTAGNTGTSGNDRFDNVTLAGDTLSSTTTTTPPTSVASLNNNPSVLVFPNPATSSIGINTSSDAAKTIAVYNMAGQNVYSTQITGKHNSINISNMPAGNYFMYINDTKTGATDILKFTKQ